MAEWIWMKFDMWVKYNAIMMPVQLECQNFNFSLKYAKKTLKFSGFRPFRTSISEMAGHIHLILCMLVAHDPRIVPVFSECHN